MGKEIVHPSMKVLENVLAIAIGVVLAGLTMFVKAD